MHESIFAELSLIIVIAAAMSLFMRLIRQPLMIGYILTGILVGPSILHLVNSAETIEVFSSIGIALLLFIIGLGLNLKVVREVGRVAGFVGTVQMIITLLIGFVFSKVLGLSAMEALFMGGAWAFSSTIIILKLLNDKKEQSRLYGKIAVGLLLVQDVAATIALLLVTANASEGGFEPSQLANLFIKGALIGGALLLVGTFVLPRGHKLIAGSQEFLFIFALAWGFGAAALFEQAGFSLEIGALIGGISLAGLPYTQEISSRLRPLRDFFIVVFFVALGTRLAFGNIFILLPYVIVGCFIVIVIKPLVVLLAMGLMGYTKRTSFKTAMTMGQVSEFSLVLIILGARSGFISNDMVATVTMVALVSIASSTYLILYSDSLFRSIEEHLSMFERRHLRREHESKSRHELVLFGYLKGGHEFLKLFKSLKMRYVVIDYDPEVIDTLESQKANYVYGDVTDIELLEEVGMEHAKLVVSTLSDYEINSFLVKLMHSINPHAVTICHAENGLDAEKLYALGATYVMVPHYLGSEKISSLIKRSGLKKSEFNKYRAKHLEYLQKHILQSSEPEEEE